MYGPFFITSTHPEQTLSPWIRTVLCTLACLAASALSAAPQVSLETTEIDFGTVRQGAQVQAELSLANSGAETLVVERLEFTVPGMNARMQQKVEPGENAAIRLTWDTSRLRGTVAGHMTLFLNDPSRPSVEIALRGEVIPALEFLPRPALYFSQFKGESQSDSIVLKSNLEKPLEIRAISASSNRFQHRVEPVEPGRRFEVAVSTRADLPPGRYRDHLVIETSDSDYPRLHVEVNILVKPDLFVTPEVVDFGTISRNALKSAAGATDFIRQSVVINRRQGTMRITSVTTDLAALQPKVSPDGPADGFLLEVGIQPEKLEAGSLEGSIRIETDDPAHPQLTIPVRGSVTD